MKVLYGVQGTGNGHITRARMMSEKLVQAGIDVDYIFSGRDDDYFNMECFGDYRRFDGLTFLTSAGSIQYLKTAKRNNLIRFWCDIKNLNVPDYDLVITDFEPISAWAAKRTGVPSLGISHQNAFRYGVPVEGANWLARTVIRNFAPADQYLGLHWHHFGYPILPPMIKTDLVLNPVEPQKILLYLPFLQQQQCYPLFHQFPEFDFVQYHPGAQASRFGNIRCTPPSRSGFLEDFSNCAGLITNSGFGACSEAVHYGKKLLTIPLKGQMEQLSNAVALKQLGYASVSRDLTYSELETWLQQPQRNPVVFPDVAQSIVDWLQNGQVQSLDELTAEVWRQVSYP